MIVKFEKKPVWTKTDTSDEKEPFHIRFKAGDWSMLHNEETGQVTVKGPDFERVLEEVANNETEAKRLATVLLRGMQDY